MTVKEDIINKFKLIKQLFDTQPIKRLTSDGDTYIPNQNCKISLVGFMISIVKKIWSWCLNR